jgi:DNA-binding transcriptional ArsR family regulator
MDAFGALADPVRRSILVELAARPHRVVDLAVTRPISRPAVSKHLRLLLEAGVVTATDRGRERYYALDPTGLHVVHQYVGGLVATAPAGPTVPIAPHALESLDTEVRRTTRERRHAARATTTTSPEETA